MISREALGTRACDSQEILSYFIFMFRFFFLSDAVFTPPHAAPPTHSLLLSLAFLDLPSPPPPPPPPPPPLVRLCLSLPSAAVTRFKVTSSHRLRGSPSLLTYFYWLMHCSARAHTHTRTQNDVHKQIHISWNVNVSIRLLDLTHSYTSNVTLSWKCIKTKISLRFFRHRCSEKV